MKYVGLIDGRKGFLRCGWCMAAWYSKARGDSYEAFCAEHMGRLRQEDEDEFKKMNILFDEDLSVTKR